MSEQDSRRRKPHPRLPSEPSDSRQSSDRQSVSSRAPGDNRHRSRPRPQGQEENPDRAKRTSTVAKSATKERTRVLHFFLNPAAALYKRRAVERLIYRVRSAHVSAEVHEATSGVGLLNEAKRVVEMTKDDKVSSHVLIAVGGDGTVNLIARATLDAELPFGILPFGRENNIARSLFGTVNPEQALDMLRQPTRQLDAIFVGDQLVLSAAGLGLLPSLHAYLLKKGAPRFGIGWGMVSSDLYKKQQSVSLTLKLDAHRLSVSTKMLSIHLLPHAAGLNLSPMSVGTDSHFEVILDQGKKNDRVSNYVRDAAAKQLRFGSGLAAYRCERVTIQSVKQQPLYLDGELVTVPSDVLDITRAPKQLVVIGAR